MSARVLEKGYKYLAIEVWLLIALGGAVRAMNAGLACPDWPLCFGDVIPDYHPQVYFEFIHRVMAGLVSITALGLAVGMYRSKEVPRMGRWLALFGLLMISAQVILGGLTVLWQLHDKVVAAHLGMGTAFFASLLWTFFMLRGQRLNTKVAAAPPALGRLSTVTLIVVFSQIILGGLVASNYAALVCTDFPKCHGQWIPTLTGPIGLQVLHRFGAYFTGLVVLIHFFVTRWLSEDQMLRRNSTAMLFMVFLQIGIGIANVLLYTPPLVTVLHLATAMTLFALTMNQVYLLRQSLVDRVAQPA